MRHQVAWSLSWKNCFRERKLASTAMQVCVQAGWCQSLFAPSETMIHIRPLNICVRSPPDLGLSVGRNSSLLRLSVGGGGAILLVNCRPCLCGLQNIVVRIYAGGDCHMYHVDITLYCWVVRRIFKRILLVWMVWLLNETHLTDEEFSHAQHVFATMSAWTMNPCFTH